MRKPIWMILGLVMTCVSAQDRYTRVSIPQAEAMVLIPEGVQQVRAVIVHAANMPLRPSERWTEIARNLHMAHMVIQIDMSGHNRPRRLRESVVPILNLASERLGHLELALVPIAATGHSAGGMGLNAFLPLEDRFLTAAIDCSWVIDYERNPRAEQIPLLFTLGAIPDNFQMLDAIETHFNPARARGAPATLGLEWGKAHNFGNAGTLFAAWFHSMAELRLTREPGIMRAIDPQSGWLGDRSSWDTAYAWIFPYAQYPANPAEAVWLPDRGFAYVWRAYQSKDAPAQLTVTHPARQSALGAFQFRSAHEFRTPAEGPLRFGITGVPEPGVKSVRFYHRDQLLGQVEQPPWVLETELPVGVYTVFAEVTLTNETRFVTNPALLILHPPQVRTEEVQ